MHTIFWLEKLMGTDHLEDLGIDEKIILDWILRKQGWGWELDSSGSRQGPVMGSCERGNEPLGTIKGKEFLDQLNEH